MQTLMHLHNYCRKKFRRFLSDKRAVSEVISATMLAGTVLTLSLVVYVWSQSVSSSYSSQYNQVVGTEIDRLKEKIVFEYVHYASAPKNVSAYLLNCGTINNVGILNTYVSNSSWFQNFPRPSLKFLNGTLTTHLNIGEEGYFVLSLSTSLKDNAYYSIRIVTERGSTFDSSFVA